MSGDSGDAVQSETVPLTTNGSLTRTSELKRPVPGYGLSFQLAELAILFAAIVGAVALGLGIGDYLGEHPYVLGYLLAYAGFRVADALLRSDPGTVQEPDAPMRQWHSDLPVLLLFATAPFERTYIYGGEALDSVAAFGLLMELAGLWLVIGSRIQLRFGAARERDTVVRRGFYRYIRHPAITGTCLVLLAWPFEYSAPVVEVVTMIVLFAVARREIRSEESEMLARFGDEYESYRRETDRLIPNVW